jgi:hypothetical protein
MTLDKVRDLGDSVTQEQVRLLRQALGDPLYNLLDLAFESKSEDEALARVSEFVTEAKKSVMKIMMARKILKDDQKAIIAELFEEVK